MSLSGGSIAMERRRFIGTLAGAAVSWPLGTLAQQGAGIPRIGFLMPGHAEGPDASRAMITAIIDGLSDLGYPCDFHHLFNLFRHLLRKVVENPHPIVR